MTQPMEMIAPLAIRMQSERMTSILEYMPTPKVAAKKLIAETTRKMKEAADQMDFLQAAQYRVEIIRLQQELELK